MGVRRETNRALLEKMKLQIWGGFERDEPFVTQANLFGLGTGVLENSAFPSWRLALWLRKPVRPVFTPKVRDAYWVSTINSSPEQHWFPINY